MSGGGGGGAAVGGSRDAVAVAHYAVSKIGVKACGERYVDGV